MPKILVIDDEQPHRDHAAGILRRAGFEVHTATDGKNALELLEQAAPDLIFCDAMMPEVDGFEVLDKVRDNPRFVGVPFVFFTAMRFAGARSEAKQRGAQEYMVKPYKAEALVANARRLLNLPAEDKGV